MTIAGWRRIISFFLRLARSTSLDRSIFKDMLLAFLLLTTSFSFYLVFEHRVPRPQLTYIPYAAIDTRGKHVTGYALITTDLREPVPLENFYRAIVEIETLQNVRQARPMVKLELQRPKTERGK